MVKSFRWLYRYADGQGNTERFKDKVSLWTITLVFPASKESVSLKLLSFPAKFCFEMEQLTPVNSY